MQFLVFLCFCWLRTHCFAGEGSDRQSHSANSKVNLAHLWGRVRNSPQIHLKSSVVQGVTSHSWQEHKVDGHRGITDVDWGSSGLRDSQKS